MSGQIQYPTPERVQWACGVAMLDYRPLMSTLLETPLPDYYPRFEPCWGQIFLCGLAGGLVSLFLFI